MELLVFILIAVVIYVGFKFFRHRESVKVDVKSKGGAKGIYQEAVEYLEEQGLEIKEITWDSVYLNYSSKKGQVEAQVVITGVDQAEMNVAVESAYGPSRQLETVLQPSDDQKTAVAHILDRLPHVKKVLPSNDTEGRSAASNTHSLKEKRHEDSQGKEWSAYRTTGQVAEEVVFIYSDVQAYNMRRDKCVVMHKGEDTLYFSAMRREDGTIMDEISFFDDDNRHVISYEELVLSDAPVLRAKNKEGIECVRKSLYDRLEEGDEAIVDYYVRETPSTTSIEAARVLAVGDERGKPGRPFIDADELNQADETGKTILHRTTLSGVERGVEVLIAAGADINATDNEGKTPLHYAAGQGHEAIVRTLIYCGADISVEDGVSGGQPLHHAAMFGNTNVCRVLIEAGANQNRPDNTGASPSMYANAAGHQSTVRYFNTVEEMARCRKAAEEGDANAQFQLGEKYSTGDAISSDPKKAVRWYRKAADQEHIEGIFSLAACYANGDGVDQDEQKALELYHRAAKQGHAAAQYLLGWRYANGDGIVQDRREAAHWYRQAAEQGHKSAEYFLGECYANGDGVERDERQAFFWYRRAAEQGHAGAEKTIQDIT